MLRIKMAYPVNSFPYYGKLQNDDEVYIACIYNPVISDQFSGYFNESYIYSENNKRLSFLSYLPLQLSTPPDTNLYVYPTLSSLENKVSFDLFFTPVSQAASIFKVKNLCNNKFELFLNDNPVYISTSIYQLKSGFQVPSEGFMFTLSKPSDQDNFVFESVINQYATFYGIFQKLNFNLRPIYKKGCVNLQCACTEKFCCIPDGTSSLSIVSLCDFQNNASSKYIPDSTDIQYDILIIPKKTRYLSFGGSIIEDNSSINNFLFTFDTIVNNNGQAPYINYAPSLFKSLEESKATYNIKYCINNEKCGTNGCYGSCIDNCLTTNIDCYNITELSECYDKKDFEDKGSQNIPELNILTIVTILFAIILSIALVVFVIVIFTKSKKKLNVTSTYNVNIMEQDDKS